MAGQEKRFIPPVLWSRIVSLWQQGGKLLDKLARGRCTALHITSLKDEKGDVHTLPIDINSIFKRYYQTMYQDILGRDEARVKRRSILEGM